MGEGLDLWNRYCELLYSNPSLGMTLDISRVRFAPDYFEKMAPAMEKAFAAMKDLEAGGIANADEQRMVGHYWLRSPDLAPEQAITSQITDTVEKILDFSRGIHQGQIRGPGGPFENLLLVGIGGSALGPQFMTDALAKQGDPVTTYFIDNTDPDGIDRTMKAIGDGLDRTLVVVTSKSGGTPEPRNGMLEAKAYFRKAGLDFARHAVAVTQEGSKLDKQAVSEGWLARFPMWDWVGGRTSETSAVGLLPAALQGIDIRQFLQGASEMDAVTRETSIKKNPAALLALMWYHLTGGVGAKDMVILPYKDRLGLFSKYLQQLVMESLGKQLDRDGKTVNQGIAVYGNKGSTDQHAYVQQLREGVNNFYATFIQVLHDRSGSDVVEVEPETTSGDFLTGFLLGTRRALYENGRDSITITVEEVTPSTIGKLIALYERAVGLYGELVNINAYHQPGVEAGKKAAAAVLALQEKLVSTLRASDSPLTASAIAEKAGAPEESETVYKILEHLASNSNRGIEYVDGDSPATAQFACKSK